jgi:hypothetical protein
MLIWNKIEKNANIIEMMPQESSGQQLQQQQ